MQKYDWTQTFETTTIEIPLDSSSSTHDIKCFFEPNRVEIRVKDETMCMGETHAPIYPKECSWYLNNQVLFVELEKVNTRDQEGWWPKLFIGDQPVEANKVSAPRNVGECSEEVQQQYERGKADLINSKERARN